MPRTPVVPSLWWLAGLLLLALACSHDSPRDNPLDPTLTPPVELQVTLDDTAGTVTLTWTRYEGEAEFGEYWVLRQVFDRVTVDTLTSSTARDSASYADTSLAADTSYIYRVSIVNAGGLEVTSPEVRVRPLALPPVEIETLDFDSRTATATLTWTPYAGPRFQAYQVQRRTESSGAVGITTIDDRANTSYVEGGLIGSVEYTYEVVVVTVAGEEVVSQPASGAIHALVGAWPLEIRGEGTAREYVRLYAEPEDRIAALLTAREGVRLLCFDEEGTLLDQQALVSSDAYSREGRDVAAALDASGHLPEQALATHRITTPVDSLHWPSIRGEPGRSRIGGWSLVSPERFLRAGSPLLLRPPMVDTAPRELLATLRRVT